MSQNIDARHEPGPVAFIILCGAGDLTWRKLIPSLFALHLNRSLPDKFAIIGVDRAALSDNANAFEGAIVFGGNFTVDPLLSALPTDS